MGTSGMKSSTQDRRAQDFEDEMKEAYESLKAEICKICMYSDTNFRDTIDA